MFETRARAAGAGSAGRGALSEIVRETIEVSEVSYGQVRVYATSGSGGVDFSLRDDDGGGARTSSRSRAVKTPPRGVEEEVEEGLSAFVSDVPIKPRFATVKSVNYLNNVLLAGDARRRASTSASSPRRTEASGKRRGRISRFSPPTVRS